MRVYAISSLDQAGHNLLELLDPPRYAYPAYLCGLEQLREPTSNYSMDKLL